MWWTALLLGLAGSIHCIGMCGPIAMALPLTAREKTIVVVQSLLYNFGRITTYALMGFLFGLMGWGVALVGYQNLLSIGIGMVLLVAALFTLSLDRKLLTQPFFTRFFNLIKNKLSQLLTIRGQGSAFRIGLLNGLLPCGLVYIALAGSVATGNHFKGALYMATFGLGTIPLMLSVMVFGKWFRQWIIRFQRFAPYGLFAFGVFLIYRGLVVDIPADLQFWEAMNFPVMCH